MYSTTLVNWGTIVVGGRSILTKTTAFTYISALSALFINLSWCAPHLLSIIHHLIVPNSCFFPIHLALLNMVSITYLIVQRWTVWAPSVLPIFLSYWDRLPSGPSISLSGGIGSRRAFPPLECRMVILSLERTHMTSVRKYCNFLD